MEKAPKWSLVPVQISGGTCGNRFYRRSLPPDLGDELVEIHGGEATNSVPDRAYAVVSGCTVEEVRGKLGNMERITVEEDARGVRFLATGNSSMHPVLRVQ